MAQNANAAVTGKTWKPITVDCNKVISDPNRRPANTDFTAAGRSVSRLKFQCFIAIIKRSKSMLAAETRRAENALIKSLFMLLTVPQRDVRLLERHRHTNGCTPPSLYLL